MKVRIETYVSATPIFIPSDQQNLVPMEVLPVRVTQRPECTVANPVCSFCSMFKGHAKKPSNQEIPVTGAQCPWKLGGALT
jgi:hypothetical protein